MSPDQDAVAPEAEVDRLYGVELGDFVAERTASARRLREQGRRAEAAAVERLRKPSVAAWIVNRMPRDAPGPLGELLDAAHRLREVQMAAGSGQDLRAASEAEQAALRAVMREAGQAAARAGSSGKATLQRVRETLHAAALDPELADQVRRGVVVREQQAVGFPVGFSAPPRPRPRRRAAKAATGGRTPPAAATEAATRPSRPPAASAQRLERATRAAATAQERLSAAEEKLSAGQATLGGAERELERVRRAMAEAERRVDRSRRQVDRAQKAQDDARLRAEEAGRRLEQLRGGANEA